MEIRDPKCSNPRASAALGQDTAQSRLQIPEEPAHDSSAPVVVMRLPSRYCSGSSRYNRVCSTEGKTDVGNTRLQQQPQHQSSQRDPKLPTGTNGARNIFLAGTRGNLTVTGGPSRVWEGDGLH